MMTGLEPEEPTQNSLQTETEREPPESSFPEVVCRPAGAELCGKNILNQGFP